MRAIGVKLSLLAVIVGVMGACRFEGTERGVVVNGEFPVAYVKRPLQALGDPVDLVTSVVGGDLYLRDISSPSSEEVNITGALTKGVGDVTDPDVSYDGERIVFALRCTTGSAPRCASDTTWNIWEYAVASGELRRVIRDDYIANLGDDIDPAYLPDGRIVFSSTRQAEVSGQLGYTPADPLGGGPASVLHVMNANGSIIEQISFHPGHEADPTVLQDGRILYTRWDNLEGQTRLSLYTMRPDGSGMFVLYGVHSPGESFVHARELPTGKLIATVIPLRGTWGGGALLEVDAKNFGDADDPAPGLGDPAAAANRAQKPATLHEIPLENKISEYGRFRTPYPLWDGSNRVLVSFSPHQGTAEDDPDSQVEADAPPMYSIYMLDLDDRSLSPLTLPQAEVAQVSPVAVRPRPRPALLPPLIPEDTGPFVNQENMGIINVKSVYDTDRLGRMGNGVLTTQERATKAIPAAPPVNAAADIRDQVADVARLKDPALTVAAQRAARFVRVIAAVPIPQELPVLDVRALTGHTPFSMQRIVGYAPLEPDGSVRVRVPADTALAISVLDDGARAFETPSAWFQVRPGETLVCDGCHSPRRVGPLNAAPIAGNHPNTRLKDSFGSVIQDPNTGGLVLAAPGETMAETRTRVDDTALSLSPDVVYVDLWTDPVTSGRSPDLPVTMRYASLTTPVPSDGYINYLEHIQPLWDKTRLQGGSDNRCSGCHNGFKDDVRNPNALDLRGSAMGATGRPVSYEELLTGDLVFNAEGRPYYDVVNGVAVLRRSSALVTPGSSRRSHLVEKLFNEELFAEQGLPFGGVNHSVMLSDAEKRLVVEWIDIGAQFVNDPYAEDGVLRGDPAELDQQEFFSKVRNIISRRCSNCHQPVSITGEPNPGFQPSQYILTGDSYSDFYNTAAMVTDVDNPAASTLLARPSSTANHPAKPSGQPILDLNDPADQQNYAIIENWIRGAQ